MLRHPHRWKGPPKRSAPLLALLLASCGSHQEPRAPDDGTAAQEQTRRAEDLVRELRDASAGEWPRLVPAVRALEQSAVPALARAVAEHRDAPGRQALIRLLGLTGNPAGAAPLIAALNSDDPASQEAAMALGLLGSPAATEPLMRAMNDRQRDPTTRTAAAGALLDLHPPSAGKSDEAAAAVAFLAGVLVAGTPAGQGLGQALGLPDRPRWARERHIAIQAIRRATGGEDFDLDTDLPWPQLEERTAQMRAALLAR